MSDGEMDDEDEQTPLLDEVDEVVEEKSSRQENEHPGESLPSLKSALKKSRWNVFLFLGVAFVMFGFALFPMTMNVPYDKLWGTAEKDIGFVWGPSASGEDFMDVPFELEVLVVSAPSITGNFSLEAYMLKAEDCQDIGLSELELVAKEGGNHDYQYSSIDSPLEGKTYSFDFDLDMGQYCVKTQFVDSGGKRLNQNTDIEAKGKLWPNQMLAGVPGLAFLGLSLFAFIGAQKKGAKIKVILEQKKVSEEQLVLEAAAAERITQGPLGPPKPAAGSAGSPQSSPPSIATSAPTTSTRSGPPPATPEPVQEPEHQPEIEAAEQNVTEESEQQIGDSSVFEPAGNGYFYRKMADGSYEQIVYVQSEDGNYVPYQQ